MSIADQEDFTTSLHVVSGTPVSPPADQPDFTRTVNVVSGGGGGGAPGLLGLTGYTPASGTVSIPIPTVFGVIADAILTVSFSTPASGPGSTQVVVEVTCSTYTSTDTFTTFGLVDHATGLQVGTSVQVYSLQNAGLPGIVTSTCKWVLDGLTPATAYRFDLAGAETFSGDAKIFVTAVTGNLGSGFYGGPFVMSAHAGLS